MDRQGRVDELTQQWRKKIWEPRADVVSAVDFANFPDMALPRPTVLEVKAAAESFPEITGLGVDRWHPRWFAWLPDQGVSAWIDVMMAAEENGWLPEAMATLTVVFIPQAVRASANRPLHGQPTVVGQDSETDCS